MRVLMTTWAWPTHYFPMVPLAWALRAAGHEVQVATQPALTWTVASSGMPVVAVGRDVDTPRWLRRMHGPATSGAAAAPRPDPSGLPTDRVPVALQMFAEVAEAMTPDLAAFARRWRPDLVVHEPSAYAGPLVAAALDVPAVRHLWGPDILAAITATERVAQAERAALAPLCASLGLSSVDPMGALTLDPCPAALQVPVPGETQPIRHIPHAGYGAAPDWLLDEPTKPRVCLTWGTAVFRTERDPLLLNAALAGIARHDVELVVLVSAEQRSAVREVPDGVRVVSSIPLDLLAPSCAAVVAHGGAGTMMTALTHGVPQLVSPLLADHRFNAHRLEATGAGIVVPSRDATPEVIADAFGALLDEPTYGESARTLAADIAARPTPAEVVTALEKLAG